MLENKKNLKGSFRRRTPKEYSINVGHTQVIDNMPRDRF